jgi:hypothetical protein
MVAGLGVEFMTMGPLSVEKRALEGLGALIGGRIGSRIPDLLEPSVGFNHWGAAHSVVGGGGGACLCFAAAIRARSGFRLLAEEMFAAAGDAGGEVAQFACTLGGMMIYVVAGAVVGVPAGYLSHLVLDELRSKGTIPLLC